MRLGYNTNGFPHHRVADVARVLAELGYDGIAITPDVFQCNPFDGGLDEARALAPLLADLGLAVAVETGARFLFDAARKHQPTLLSRADGAAVRLDGLRRCLELAVVLGAETCSFWSGTWAPMPGEDVVPPTADEQLERLCAGAAALLDEAAGTPVRVCFEPEPGMAIASMADAAAFFARLGRDDLVLMLDVGHVPVTEHVPPAQALAEWAPRLAGVQLDDSRGGVHEHLAPGDGELDWPAVLAAIAALDSDPLCCLELPRHGHDPVTTARAALGFLRARGA